MSAGEKQVRAGVPVHAVRPADGARLDVTFLGYTNDVFEESGKHYITLVYAAALPPGQKPGRTEPDKMAEWLWRPLHDLPRPLCLPVRTMIATPSLQAEMTRYNEAVRRAPSPEAP